MPKHTCTNLHISTHTCTYLHMPAHTCAYLHILARGDRTVAAAVVHNLHCAGAWLLQQLHLPVFQHHGGLPRQQRVPCHVRHGCAAPEHTAPQQLPPVAHRHRLLLLLLWEPVHISTTRTNSTAVAISPFFSTSGSSSRLASQLPIHASAPWLFVWSTLRCQRGQGKKMDDVACAHGHQVRCTLQVRVLLYCYLQHRKRTAGHFVPQMQLQANTGSASFCHKLNITSCVFVRAVTAAIKQKKLPYWGGSTVCASA